MLPMYDSQAPKKATNLSVNSDLLKKARALDINLSAALEQALAQLLRQRQQEQWLKENRAAIAAYNQEVEAHGVFGDTLRSF
ncbi:MAG TPA: type II toxin-antitoxin system CcdA family antitoxin [Anaerolineales bacterium]|nr:type II toxin-antitoxin system CcdA family antitoxin [Anaerolineales bacterium]